MTSAVNDSEQFVYDVCKRSFLSLWSYVNPQGKEPAKELCDILVVCDPHVVVFSVKEVALKDSNETVVNWRRWQRKAIDASRKQVAGAVRVLDRFDAVRTKEGKAGLPLPPSDQRRYHRIAVAFGGRREVPIQSGSAEGEEFCHVLDEQSFYLLLRHLDTITDFIQYLEAKEKFLTGCNVVMSGGEEQLLAFYLHEGRVFPEEPDMLVLQDDLWDGVSAKPEYIAKLKEDKISYAWDEFIEPLCSGSFEGHCWDGPSMSESERALRVLALENRFNRRVLARAMTEFLERAKLGQSRARCVESLSGVVYVFFAYRANDSVDTRKYELLGRCFAAICRYPAAETIVGINMNVPGEKPIVGFSYSLAMLEASDGIWSDEILEKAKYCRDELGFFKSPLETRLREDEYPLE